MRDRGGGRWKEKPPRGISGRCQGRAAGSFSSSFPFIVSVLLCSNLSNKNNTPRPVSAFRKDKEVLPLQKYFEGCGYTVYETGQTKKQ